MTVEDKLKALYAKLPDAPSANFQFRQIGINPYEHLPENAIILDVGSKNARGRYGFGEPSESAALFCVDLFPGEGVDLVADAQNLDTIVEGSVDCVLLVDVLQHVPHPDRVAKSIYRVLKPRGILFATAPFIYPYHQDPEDYNRFSFRGLAALFDELEALEVGFRRGPMSTMAHMNIHFLAVIFSFNNRYLHTILLGLFKWLLSWTKYLDVIFGHFSQAHFFHTASYFIGRKRMLERGDSDRRAA